MSGTVRNVVIIAALAAVVAFAPGGGTGSNVVLQAVWLVFLAAMVWVASIMYRERRNELYSLGDGRRAALYGAVLVVTLTLTATHRLWQTSAGEVVWLILMGGAIYVGATVLRAARRY